MVTICIKKDFIKLGQLLKISGIISMGSEAKTYLAEYGILVNNEPESRRGRKLFSGDVISAGNESFLIVKSNDYKENNPPEL